MRHGLYRLLALGLVLPSFAGIAYAGAALETAAWNRDEWRHSPTGLFAVQIVSAAAECKKEQPNAPQGEFKQCVWREHETVALPARWQTDGLEAVECTDYSDDGDYNYRATILLPDSIEFPLIIPDIGDCKRVQAHVRS